MGASVADYVVAATAGVVLVGVTILGVFWTIASIRTMRKLFRR